MRLLLQALGYNNINTNIYYIYIIYINSYFL